MKKRFLLFITFTLNVLLSFSQSISPSENNEFCPSTNITFTVTLPRVANSAMLTVTGWTNTPNVVSHTANNPTHTDARTTFTFVAKFKDVNVAQSFKIDYTPIGGAPTSYIVTFRKIKSLYHDNGSTNNCPSIQPNQSSVTAARCQQVTVPISFPTVKWKTFGENDCWGTVNDYEYLLPVGWKLNGETSIGNNWIRGLNSVNVTSALADGEYILVRPANSCGTGLANGQTPVAIGIVRPEPTLNISPRVQTICSGTATYTISGLPSGASVSWSVSDPGQASVVPQSGNQLVAEVSRTGSANTYITLTATVTYCSYTSYARARVILGTPPPEDIIGMDMAEHFSGGQYVNLNINEAATGYTWTVSGATIIGSNTGPTLYAKLDNCFPGQNAYNYFSASISYENECGTSLTIWETAFAECDGGWTPDPGFSAKLSPNPAKGDLYVEISKESTAVKLLGKNTNVQYDLYDLYTGQLTRHWAYKNDQHKRALNVRGLKKGMYVLRISSGAYKQSLKVMIE